MAVRGRDEATHCRGSSWRTTTVGPSPIQEASCAVVSSALIRSPAALILPSAAHSSLPTDPGPPCTVNCLDLCSPLLPAHTPPAHCSLPTALCQLLAVCCSLPTALCPLLPVHCSLPTALCRSRSALGALSAALCPLSAACCANFPTHRSLSCRAQKIAALCLLPSLSTVICSLLSALSTASRQLLCSWFTACCPLCLLPTAF